MLLQFILCWLWGLLILASFIGWGWFVGRLLFKRQRIEVGLQAGWGLSLFVCFGGLLNLFHLVYPFILFGLVGAGLLCCFIQIVIERKILCRLLDCFRQIHSNKFILTGVLLIVMLAFLKYTYSVYHYQFNRHDDFQGYLVHPLKMLQQHSIGTDPFNTRQLVTSLGGTSFLQTLVVYIFPLNFITCIDLGIGLLIVLLVIAFYPKPAYPVTGRVALTLLFLLIPVSMFLANVTGFLLAIAMFLCLFMTCERFLLKSGTFICNSFVIALVTSAVCTLKSTYIIPAVMFVGIAYILRYACLRAVKRSAGTIRECIATCVLVGLMLLPWMLLMYRSGGTLLYPILGEGYYASRYTDFYIHADINSWDFVIVLKQIMRVFSNIYVVSFCLLFGCCFKYICKRLLDHSVLLSFGLSVCFGILTIWYGVSGYGVVRYSFPFVCAAVFVFLIKIVSRECGYSFFSKTSGYSILIIVAGMMIGDGIKSSPDFIFGLHNRIKYMIHNNRLPASGERERLACLQESIPSGTPLLVRLEKPFLLDFQRNPIYVIDLPGETSPPPGLPYGQGPETLAEYLTSHSIRYVAYSYASQANYSRELLERRLMSNRHKWVHFQAERIADFQRNLDKLMKTRELIYNDGDMCVIDLKDLKSSDRQ
jgi:hypothetical protein